MTAELHAELYDLMRALHFAKKLEILIDNCQQSSLTEDTPLRVSVPHFQTKDAIEQLKSHIQKLIANERINKK